MSDDSVRMRIESLKLGESYAQAIKHDWTAHGSLDEGALAARIELMRNNMQPAVHRAERSGGGEYTIEAGTFYNRSQVPICVIVVTCTVASTLARVSEMASDL